MELSNIMEIILIPIIYLTIGCIVSLSEYAFHCWNYKKNYTNKYKGFSYYAEEHSMEGAFLIFAWPVYFLLGIPYLIYNYIKKQIEKKLL